VKPASAVLLAVVVLVGILAVSFGGCAISTVQKEATLKNQIRRQSETNEASLDTMWKTLKSKAQISDQATTQIKDLNKVYEELVSGREGGTLFKMVTENYPNLGQQEVAGLYKDLMQSVEAERKTFKRDQTDLQDFILQRDSMIDGPVSGMILGWFGDTKKFKRKGTADADSWDPDYTYVFVTSTASQQMAATGAEDDISLFDAPKAEK